MRTPTFAALAGAFVLALAGCGSDSAPLSGSIRIDGPREAAPLTKAIARRFTAAHSGVRITVGASGTARGFAELCHDATELSDALAPAGGASGDPCRSEGSAPAQLPVAHDAIVLLVAPQIPVRCLTTRQLRQIWHRNSEVHSRWGEVDDLNPPFQGEMTAWGPGTDTEQFHFFNEAINGRWNSYRDYNNVLHKLENLVPGVLGTPGNLGYTEYAMYREHADEVRAIAVDSGHGCVAPTPATIAAGRYQPLTRELSLYASAHALRRRVVAEFLRYYLDHVQEVAPSAGFVAPTDGQLDASRTRLTRLLDAAAPQGR